MPRKKRRSPPEKKRLSYAKDRRNCYGESTTSARKSIPLRKALANRAVRRLAKSSLSVNDTEASDALLAKKLKARWKKVPDQPLRAHLGRKRSARKVSFRDR